MKENKGFTLIELLAVIVILAIIALIATPIVLNIIDDARKSAQDDTRRMIINGVQTAYSTKYMNTSNTSGALPTSAEVATEFNNIMENATWNTSGESAGHITSSNNVSCDIDDNSTTSDPGTVTVTCTLSDNTTIATKALNVAKKAS